LVKLRKDLVKNRVALFLGDGGPWLLSSKVAKRAKKKKCDRRKRVKNKIALRVNASDFRKRAL